MPAVPIYGIDKELAAKQAAKYDKQRELEARVWLEAVLQQPGILAVGAQKDDDSQDFLNKLKDGQILAK